MKTTLAQQRAAFALDQLENLTCKRADFKSFAAGLPSIILQNGFGQALAFLAAKGQDKHLAGLKIILAWLVERKFLPAAEPREQIRAISAMEQMQYLQAQKETLAMLEWLKRYANADLFAEV